MGSSIICHEWENNTIKSFIFLIKIFKIDLNTQGNGSKNPLFLIAIKREILDIIDYLIKKDCVNFNIRTKNDYTNANFAIQFLKNTIDLVKKIINVQSKDNLNVLAENQYSIDDFIERYIDSNENKRELKELVANLIANTINIEKIEDLKNKEIN